MSLLFREWGPSLIVTTMLTLVGWLVYDTGLQNGEQRSREMHKEYEVLAPPGDNDTREYLQRNFRHLMNVYIECKSDLEQARCEIQELRRQLKEQP